VENCHHEIESKRNQSVEAKGQPLVETGPSGEEKATGRAVPASRDSPSFPKITTHQTPDTPGPDVLRISVFIREFPQPSLH
jgi:hypothetical protein